MTKQEFRALFIQAINIAAANADKIAARPVPRSFSIALQFSGEEDKYVDIDVALDRLYLGQNRFYKIIDVAITDIFPGNSIVYVRPSGHKPVDFAGTWDPTALGPFKQMFASEIVVHQN